MSAHCSGNSAGRCRWYLGNQLRALAWAGNRRGARGLGGQGSRQLPLGPRVRLGHWYYDSCDDNDTRVRFPIVTSAQNIGSSIRPLRTGG